ncbi:ceramide synthase 1 [Sarcoptes scabiei]|nr:ceramide synthase 1 [Sarcoptes scabiei]
MDKKINKTIYRDQSTPVIWSTKCIKYLIIIIIIIVTISLFSLPVECSSKKSLLSWEQHLNLNQSKQFIRQLTEQSETNKLIQTITIGKSVLGNDLWMLRISTEHQNLSQSLRTIEDLHRHYENHRALLKPTVKFIATIHGNEPLGKQLLFALAETLQNDYNDGDERVKRILAATNIELLPLMNPDGFEVAIEGDCNGVRFSKHRWNGRENRKNIDLNDDFLSTIVSNDAIDKIQPETLSVMTWIMMNPSLVLSASIHSGRNLISYPFDGREKKTNDEKLFQILAKNFIKNMNDSTRFLNESCLQETTIKNGIANGYEMDPDSLRLKNSMSDFNYLNQDCLELNLYLGCCKYPNSSVIKSEWNNYRESILQFIESSHWGVKGLVKDSLDRAINNSIILITPIVDGEKKFTMTINHTTSGRGEYWFLLLPGEYHIKVEAKGFEFAQKEITISDHQDSKRLGPLSAMIQNFTLKSSNKFTENTKLDGENVLDNEKNKEKDFDNLPSFRKPIEFKHHNYYQMHKFLKELHSNYSTITRLYSIGQSVQNRELLVLEISDSPGQHEMLEPEFKYIANMHGNEVVGREMLLLLAKLLLENYGHHPKVDWLINNTRIHLLPSMNPDGYERSTIGDCDSLIGRGNANNVDLNRNFPDQYRVYDENRIQEKETLAVMQWLRQYPFVLSANLHGGALVANYPFDGTNKSVDREYNGTPDDLLFRHLALSYANNHPHMHKGHCFKKCVNNELTNEYYPHGIINGANWYVLYGGMQDWNYLHTNCFEITLEMGCHKYPPAKELPRLWRENKRPLFKFIDQVHRGIKGLVRDAQTNGSVIGAEIHINTSVHSVRSAEPYGDYWRLLLPGNYLITVTKPGYEIIERQITIPKDQSMALKIDFYLRSKISNRKTTSDFLIFTIILLILFSILFFIFCMSIVWCPQTLARLFHRTGLLNFLIDFDPRKCFEQQPKKNTFYYSKLNDEEFLNDSSDPELN